MQVFLLAMASYPEVQRQAQNEIDAVVGHGRLPCFADRDSLPYLNQVFLETLRWYPVIPTGLYASVSMDYLLLTRRLRLLGAPHTSEQDDVYGKYFLPKGTVIFINSW